MKLHNFFSSEALTFALRLLLMTCLVQWIFFGSGFYFSKYYLQLSREMEVLTHASFAVATFVLVFSRLISEINSTNERLIKLSFGFASITEFVMVLSYFS